DGDDICDELVPLPPYVINERRGDYGLPDDLFGDPNAGHDRDFDGGGGGGGSVGTAEDAPNRTEEKKTRCQELRETLNRVAKQSEFASPIEAVLQLSGTIFAKPVGSAGEWGGLSYFDSTSFRNTGLSYNGDPNGRDYYHPSPEQFAIVEGRGNSLAGVAHGHPSGGPLSLGDHKTALGTNAPVTAVGANGNLYLFDPRSLGVDARSGMLSAVQSALDLNERDGKWNIESKQWRNLDPAIKAALTDPALLTECPEFFK
ncbi:MAG: hypothetical protein ACREIA_00445, partial [Opitutaceae bacterium]